MGQAAPAPERGTQCRKLPDVRTGEILLSAHSLELFELDNGLTNLGLKSK